MTTYDEGVSGDLSDNNLSPTGIVLTAGDNMVTATQGIPDDDYITVTIPAGHRLEQIIVIAYSDPDVAFIAVDQGATFSESSSSPDPANLLGGMHYGPAHIGTDILDNMGSSTGLGFPGFTPPLTGTTYSFWFNQTADDSTVTLNFVVVAFGPTAGPDSLTGGAGGDTIDALGGGDTVDGAAGNDSLFGNDGSDLLIGQAGNDTLNGGSGNDSADGGANNDVLGGGGGRDTLSGGDGDDNLAGQIGKDTLLGGLGIDTLSGGGKGDSMDGGANNDVLTGGGGNDAMLGADGADAMAGIAGRDNMQGGAGDDSISGGNGDDTISGGNGLDSLTGGLGNDSVLCGDDNDVVVFTIGAGVDTINDFGAGAGFGDVIRLLGFGPTFDTFAEVIAAATDDGTNTTIDFGGGAMLILQNVIVADLDASDFTFS